MTDNHCGITMSINHDCTGYIKESRKPVTDHLFRVVKQLRAEHAVARGGSALQIVAGARIPIIRVRASACNSCQQWHPQ